MQFNRMIPELSVSNINKTKQFYLELLNFTLEYERVEDKFIFLSFEGSQFMFEELHTNGWNIGDMKYPLGQGINFSITVNDIDSLYQRIIQAQYPLYRALTETTYQCNNETVIQKEFLIQDRDGYLLRFTHS